jgi:hypothetical protein
MEVLMLQEAVGSSGITFAVDEVRPATTPLREQRAHEALRAMVKGDLESCSDYHGAVIKDVNYQPLLAAVYLAFSGHRPLVLTPDAVWVTITQGIAHHMAIHGERLRDRFVSHQGKLELVFCCDDWIEGTPENPWGQAFASWAGQIRDHVGEEVHDILICDFSTSGPCERAVSQIIMMDVFERYFHYVAYCICGIPTVTLEGAPADWQRLRDKAEALKIFDIDWWLKHLLPVCDQFIRASRGDVDGEHWRNICKLENDYGGDRINGWVAKLFPYLRQFIGGPCSKPNPIFESGEGFQTLDAPGGLSSVPFTWRNAITMRERQMQAIGGLIGVSQDAQSLALRPKVGWAIRPAEKIDVLLGTLAKEHTTFPVPKAKTKEERPSRGEHPADLLAFYHVTDGAELFGGGATAPIRIVPKSDLTRLYWTAGDWHRLAVLADGSSLAINLEHYPPDPNRAPGSPHEPLFHPICHVSKSKDRPGRNPVIARSFTELLERLLEGGGKLYWRERRYSGYGNAEQYAGRH